MTDTITTQWGTEARPFRAYSRGELLFLLQHCQQIMADISKDTGIETFLTYGCLLGAARTGSVIPHDFDFDLGFLVRDAGPKSILHTANVLIEYLTARLFKITSESNGQFKAAYHDREFAIELEFFAAWTEAGKFNHYFAVKDKNISEAIIPFGTIELEGIPFVAPKEPEVLLEAIYGSTWRIPDPSFRYALTSDDWLPFEFLFTNKNQNFWEKYYGGSRDNRVWVESPSQFAVYVAAHVRQGTKILDIGCGNGRDSIFFAKMGLDVICADYSTHALEACERSAKMAGVEINRQILSISSFAQVLEFGSQYHDSIDTVYARFFLHAIDEVAESNLLRLAHDVLRTGGKFMLEYRCVDAIDGSKVYENGEHYRRMIVKDNFEQHAIASGFTVEYTVEGKGLATFRSEDPFIGRTVLVKAPVAR